MHKQIQFVVTYVLYWLLFFIAGRLVFILFHYDIYSDYSILTILAIFGHGFILDLSLASYYMLLPSAALIFFSMFGYSRFRQYLNMYSLVLLALSTVITILDNELYTHWGFRIDSTPLLYMQSPSEMLASIDWQMLSRQMFTGFLLFGIFYFFYKRLHFNRIHICRRSWQASVFYLLFSSFLLIPIRGGVDITPLNIGNVFFHEQPVINHAAINPVWNLGYSLSNLENQKNPFDCYENNELKTVMDSLFISKAITANKLKNKKPNIVLIVLESFTSKVMNVHSENVKITPNLDSIAENGIFFDNVFANGDRTDKGIVSILSGYPVLPTTSVIKYYNKTEHLPSIVKKLREATYSTSFYYGGEINFANLKSYLVGCGYDELITGKHFPYNQYHYSKWGVPDEHVFKKLAEDIKLENAPFFKTFLTLSSHEPFDVPMQTAIEGSDAESRFLNAVHYTDKCLGEFYRELKAWEGWENLLLIIIADHGSRHPGNSASCEEAKFTIPMIWDGGAVVGDTTIHTLCGQTDLAATLLNQLDLNSEMFVYSKDLLNKNTPSWTIYTFNNGFGFITDSTKYIYQLECNGITYFQGNKSLSLEKKGKAYMQSVYNDFLKR